jgi:hypothetical protein
MTQIDSSAIASVLGIDVQYVALAGGSRAVLPPRIAVFAQGQTGVSFPATKAQYTSAGAAGAIYGYKSAIYLALRELFPSNGDGVGVIPVTVYPMTDAVGATAATGDLTPSGTASFAADYQVRVGGVTSKTFGIPTGAIDVSLTLAKVGFAMNSVLHMPVTTTYAYGLVAASALVGTGNGTIGTLSVAAPALPGVYKLVLNTAVVNGGVWTLTDQLGNVLSRTVTQTVGAGTATAFTVNGLTFTITDGTTDFGVGATFTITVPATKINFTAGWKGTTGNLMKIEVLQQQTGVAWAATAMAGGLTDPDPTTQLGLVGNVWEVFGLNTLPIANTTALDAYQNFGEGRWGTTVHKPIVVFTGTTHSTVDLASAVSSTRKTDKINSVIAAPDSPTLPFVVAARAVARMAVQAGVNPALDFCGLPLTSAGFGVIPGADSAQWDFPTRDQANKAGCSTTSIEDNVVVLEDIVTFYAPTGEEPPAYRHVKDIVKIMNIVFNEALIFGGPKWRRAVLIPTEQVTTNPDARKPSSAIAEIAGLADDLGLAALISDPAFTKKSTTARIAAPNRIDVKSTWLLSGNTKQKAVTLEFGYYVGPQAVVA